MEQVGGQEGGANANDPPATQQNVQLLLELATRQVPSLPSSLSLSLSRALARALTPECAGGGKEDQGQSTAAQGKKYAKVCFMCFILSDENAMSPELVLLSVLSWTSCRHALFLCPLQPRC